VAAPDHPLAALSPVDTRDLVGAQIVAKEPRCPYGAGLERALIGAGIYPAAGLSFASLEAVKQSVVAGLGVALLPEVAVQAKVAQGRLVALPWSESSPELFTQMVYHPARKLPALGLFLAVAREVLVPV
jgi:DNA-binding transcriptional LysR family regulator